MLYEFMVLGCRDSTTLNQKVVSSIPAGVKVMCVFVIFRATINKLCLMLALKLQGLI